MRKTCPVCKKSHRNKKYCSRLCQGKDIEYKIHLDKTTWKKCPNCEKPHKNATFCSNKCKGAYYKVNSTLIRAHNWKNCEACGEPFRAHRRTTKYCSLGCRERKYLFDFDFACNTSCIKARTEHKQHPNTYLTLTKEKAFILGLIFRFGRLVNFNEIKFFSEKKEALEELSKLLKSTYPINKVEFPFNGFYMRFISEHFTFHMIDYGLGTYLTFNDFPTLKQELWGDFIRGYLKWTQRKKNPLNGKTMFLVPSPKIAYQLKDVGFNLMCDGRWWVY